jgi:hypothetical protein
MPNQVDSNRSAFVERAARAYLAHLKRGRREARDVEIINRNAERLNAEARDVLRYQRVPCTLRRWFFPPYLSQSEYALYRSCVALRSEPACRR